jgi:hypothetical protein
MPVSLLLSNESVLTLNCPMTSWNALLPLSHQTTINNSADAQRLRREQEPFVVPGF